MSIDFEELIYRQVESDTLDYKAHQSWNDMSAVARGKFIRHLAAFANTDGGYLVVGVGEDASGCPCDYTGLTAEESRSFDPSAVGAYINRCVEPPIDFSLERPIVRGKRYAVFVVRPFTDLPHVCTRGIENELQTGVFYIRTQDASSRPARRAAEMHHLIRRALRNQRELLAKMLRGILYESRNASDCLEEPRRADTEAPDDVFASSLAYFRRRRAPLPGSSGMLLTCSAVVPDAPEFPADRLREAALRSVGGEKFVSALEVSRANRGNVAWRYLSPDSPRMFQLFRRGWVFYVEYPRTGGAEVPISYMAYGFAAWCRFASVYYRELGFADDARIELAFEASGLSGTVVRSGDRDYPALVPQVRGTLSRSVRDLGNDVPGYAVRLLRVFGEEGFGLPDSALRAEERRIASAFRENAL